MHVSRFFYSTAANLSGSTAANVGSKPPTRVRRLLTSPAFSQEHSSWTDDVREAIAESGIETITDFAYFFTIRAQAEGVGLGGAWTEAERDGKAVAFTDARKVLRSKHTIPRTDWVAGASAIVRLTRSYRLHVRHDHYASGRQKSSKKICSIFRLHICHSRLRDWRRWTKHCANHTLVSHRCPEHNIRDFSAAEGEHDRQQSLLLSAMVLCSSPAPSAPTSKAAPTSSQRRRATTSKSARATNAPQIGSHRQTPRGKQRDVLVLLWATGSARQPCASPISRERSLSRATMSRPDAVRGEGDLALSFALASQFSQEVHTRRCATAGASSTSLASSQHLILWNSLAVRSSFGLDITELNTFSLRKF